MRIRILPLLLLLGICRMGFAQEPPVKFGKVTAADLAKKTYSIDSSAGAIVLSDVGSTEIVGNSKSGFSFLFKRHKRVHILNRNAFDEATVEIPIYTNGEAEEKLEHLKASTYNLEEGVLKESRLDKEGVFSEAISRNSVHKKFTLPNVKEGSIIEFEYRINSDFLFNLQPWSFQGEHPVLWSEYRLALPQFLNYVFLKQGVQAFAINTQKDRMENFTIQGADNGYTTKRYTFSCHVTDYRWAMKDVLPLRHENFTSSLSNYISRIEFQLASEQEPLGNRNIMGTWPDLMQTLMEKEDFGRQVSSTSFWLNEVVEPLTEGIKTETEKARRIYAFVRDNITATGYASIYTTRSLRNVLKNRNGTVAEVNLLLVAMLKQAGIQTDPVILSTRENGMTYSLYPIIGRFNYVVARAKADSTYFLLDASQTKLGFGKLLPYCYNGQARVVDSAATALELDPATLKEKKVTAVFMRSSRNHGWKGSFRLNPGYYESFGIRNRIAAEGSEIFFQNLVKRSGLELSIEETGIDSLHRLEDPLSIRYDFSLNMADAPVLYINPLFGEGFPENPFRSARRQYPVEMPYTFDETYIASIEVPEGYAVDELPKPLTVKYSEGDDGLFEYLVSQTGNTISLRSRLYFTRTVFQPEEYETLRAFFNLVVAKQKEKMVFKRKN